MSTDALPTLAGSAVTYTPMPDNWAYPGNINEPNSQSTLWLYVLLDVRQRHVSILTRRDEDGYAGLPGDHRQWVKLPGRLGDASFELIGVAPRMSFILHLRRRDDINSFLHDVAVPLAQEIVDNLIPVPDTDGDLDWTAHAAHAADELRFACDYPFGVPVANDRGVSVAQQRLDIRNLGGCYVDASRFFEVRADLVEQRWAGMDDEQLNDAADSICRFLISRRVDSHQEGIHEQFGIARLSTGDWPHLRLVGVRSVLYGYRKRVAGDLRVESASRWFAQPEHAALITADLTDAEVTALVTEQTRDALCKGLQLTGAESLIRLRRTEARNAVRAEAPTVRDAYTAAKTAFDAAARRRAALVDRILAWNEPHDGDAQVSKLTGMSHTAVAGRRAAQTADGAGDE